MQQLWIRLAGPKSAALHSVESYLQPIWDQLVLHKYKTAQILVPAFHYLGISWPFVMTTYKKIRKMLNIHSCIVDYIWPYLGTNQVSNFPIGCTCTTFLNLEHSFFPISLRSFGYALFNQRQSKNIYKKRSCSNNFRRFWIKRFAVCTYFFWNFGRVPILKPLFR